MASSDLKGIPVSPLTGVLDARSSPDEMPANSLRLRKNFQTIAQGKLRRGTGWTKLLSISNYNNSDFHDQLVIFTPGGIRQPITMQFEAESTRGVRTLFVATQGKIAQLNEFSGNYRILGSGFGGDQSTKASAPRFHCAQVGDFLAFTNDFERPMYHRLENNGVDTFEPLLNFDDFELIGLSRAGICWAWHDCLFFADVEMDSQRFGYRLLWSNFRDPTSFDPAKLDSITGSQDLFTHERILGGRPLGNSFLIYTTHGIWEMVVVGGDQSFSFRRVYNGEDNQGVGVLKYPNTLVNLGTVHSYMAEDGIYNFSLFAPPSRLEWLHRASSLIYDSIDPNLCSVNVSNYSRNELLISVARIGASNDCPDITLRANILYQTADIVDHGFTSFCNYRSYSVPTIRDFILQNEICDAAGLIAAGYPWTNEGLPRPIPASSAAFMPKSFYTSIAQVIDGIITTEDWNQAMAATDSLCALLGNERLDDICRKCPGNILLVACSSSDWCLKELGDSVFYRERCVNPTAIGTTDSNGYTTAVGSYLLDGYDSILAFAPMFSTRQSGDPIIQCDQVRLDCIPIVQSPPSSIGLRIGISATPSDSNVDTSQIVWNQHSQQLLASRTKKTPAEHLIANTIPVDFLAWVFYRVGRVLYVELKISGTGGDATFSAVRADVKLKETNNY